MKMQLLKKVESCPRDGEWLWELKYDGWRVMALIEKGLVKLVTRNNNDCTEKFSAISQSLIKLDDCILDGEMIVVDENGRTDFYALRKPPQERLVYIVFDILFYNGDDLRPQPLLYRKQLLADAVKASSNNIQISEYTKGDCKEIFESICKGGHEGIVGKLTDSVYSGGRTGAWIKLLNPNYKRQ